MSTDIDTFYPENQHYLFLFLDISLQKSDLCSWFCYLLSEKRKDRITKNLSVVFGALKAFHLCRRKIKRPTSTKLSGKSQRETRRDDTVGTRTAMTCLNAPGMFVFPGCCGCSVPPLRWDRIFVWRSLTEQVAACVCRCVFTWKQRLLNEVEKCVQLCRHSACRWFTGNEVKSCFFNVSAEYQLINSHQV